MKIKMQITLEMTPEQLRSWANEYGLAQDEAASDADTHLRGLVEEHVESIWQVQEFTTVTVR